jgi:hypothetical protein
VSFFVYDLSNAFVFSLPDTLYALASLKSMILITGEIRCDVTHQLFLDACKAKGFSLKSINKKDLDKDFVDDMVFIFQLKKITMDRTPSTD